LSDSSNRALLMAQLCAIAKTLARKGIRTLQA
jgi:hypothetical protein